MRLLPDTLVIFALVLSSVTATRAAGQSIRDLSDEQIVRIHAAVFAQFGMSAERLEQRSMEFEMLPEENRRQAIEEIRGQLSLLFISDLPGEKLAELDAALVRGKLPSSSELMTALRNHRQAILQRRRFETDGEYSAFKELLQWGGQGLGEEERGHIARMLSDFEKSILARTASREAVAALESLNRAIMSRTSPGGDVYGRDEIDPLLWKDSSHLLAGESRQRLLDSLGAVDRLPDADLRNCRPAQRGLVQNRVWSVFDHAVRRVGDISDVAMPIAAPDRELLQALGRVMAKLALSDAEIAAISDPLIEASRSGKWPEKPHNAGGPDAFMPADLVSPNGAWTNLGRPAGEGPIAKVHAEQFGGRSTFQLRARFPEGGPAVADYFKAVVDFPMPWLPDETNSAPAGSGRQYRHNPELPVLPKGAQFALVRRLAVVDRRGHWQETALTLSLQLRFYHLTTRDELRAAGGRRAQSVAEFLLETDAVASGGDAHMRAVPADEKHFMFLLAHSFDQVDGAGLPSSGFVGGPNDVPMQHCANCHMGAGLSSINALGGFFSRAPVPLWLEEQSESVQAEATQIWKTSRAEWGVLQTFWKGPETSAASR